MSLKIFKIYRTTHFRAISRLASVSNCTVDSGFALVFEIGSETAKIQHFQILTKLAQMESALSFKAIITVTAALAASALVLRQVMRKRHRPLVLCGPSGVGKGTFITLLMKDFPGMFAKRVSHTTRAPRKVHS